MSDKEPKSKNISRSKRFENSTIHGAGLAAGVGLSSMIFDKIKSSKDDASTSDVSEASSDGNIISSIFDMLS